MSKTVNLAVLVIVSVLLLAGSTVNAEVFTVELPTLLGELQSYPNGSTSLFDFGNSFAEINEARIQLIGTFTPGQAHGDGMWNPVDEWIELTPEIEVYMDPGDGSCLTFLHPLESPFDTEEAFELKYGATWGFLLDGSSEVYADLGFGILVGWIIDTEPTVDISGAYLIVDGVVPEPATILLLSMGIVCIRVKKYKKTRQS